MATDKQKGGSPTDFIVYFSITYSLCKQQAQYISFSRFCPEWYITFSSIEVLCNTYKIHITTNVKFYTFIVIMLLHHAMSTRAVQHTAQTVNFTAPNFFLFL